MKQPLRVHVERECDLAYLEYRDRTESTGWYAVLREPDGTVQEYGRDDGRSDEPLGVLVEVDDDDQIVAIEIISIADSELLSIARDYARDNGLAFPDDAALAAAREEAA